MSTCKAFEVLQSLSVTSAQLNDHLKAIQKFLGFTGKDVDGIYGVATITRLERIFDTTIPTLPANTSMILSNKGIENIMQWEIGGKAAYISKYKNPMWPEWHSGVTIGIGYDLGYCNAAKFIEDFKALQQTDKNKLSCVVGLKGEDAENALTQDIKSLNVPWEIASEVYYSTSIPEHAKMTKKIYPEIAQLPPNAQAAILSLVYNRGTKLTGDSRTEMFNLVQLIRDKKLNAIAAEFRSMKRLWEPKKDKDGKVIKKGLHGLIIRREAEAVMIENATWVMAPTEYIFA
ncbi:MAG: hypothetical protein IPO27_18765 [Bacteroidetes bacterium]|nr:hypothetical protein [Bacteroidota bacterium]